MKIVFFHQNPQRMGGSLLQFANLANKIARYTDYEVYYIDCKNEDIQKLMESEQSHYLDVNEADYSQFETAVFITPPNYIFLLLDKIRELKHAKILLYDWHAFCVKYLMNQLRLRNTDVQSIFQVFADRDAMCFMDMAAYQCMREDTGISFRKKLVPIVKDFPEQLDTFPPRRNKTGISVAYLGRLDIDKIFSVINIADNLFHSSFEGTVDFHIIGDGTCRNRIDTSKYAGKIRFIFTSYLTGEKMYQYLYENIDVLITMGTAAINGAELGIPTLIVPMGEGCFYTDKFAFLYDMKDYSLGYSYLQLQELGYDYHTLEDAIRMAVNDKESYGSKCFRHIQDYHRPETATKAVLQYIRDTKLTVQDALEIPGFLPHLEDYQRFRRKTGSDYEGYTASVQRSFSQNQLGRYAKWRTLLINNFVDKPLNFAQKYYLKHFYYKKFMALQEHYADVIPKITAKIKRGEKIKVAFLPISASTFPSLSLFLQMLEDDLFDPYIVVVPDAQRSFEYRVETYQTTFSTLSELYGERVRQGYDIEFDQFIEIKEEYDIVCFNNPYPKMAHPYHYVDYFLDKDVLTMYVNYGFFTLKYGRNIVALDFYNQVWKVFLDSEENYQDLKKTQKLRGKNGVVVGYMKMDDMACAEIVPRTRKRVLICPHHTVMGWKALDISNFLQYSQFILELPRRYPQVDFVFRPHVQLFYNLLDKNIWTQKQVDDYMAEIEKIPNMFYDQSGDYRQVFANSDAMIHDCGSFVAEYLFTEKPCCYMLKDEAQITETFLPMGQKCLEHYYKAFSKEDICRFVEEVVLDGKDPMKAKRENFARARLKFNYPNSGKAALDYIKSQLLPKDWGKRNE